jgi:cytochrome P450
MTRTQERHDLSQLEFWLKPLLERLEHYRWMRDETPVSWHGSATPHDGKGFWVVVRYEDIRHVSRTPEIFSSASGVVIMDEDPSEEMLGVQSFLVMDDPEHMRLRALVQKAFSPRQVKLLEEQITQEAKAVVADLDEHETGDFVTRVSKRLPLMTICRMLGVPEADRDKLLAQVDAVVSYQDPEFLHGRDSFEVMKAAVSDIAMFAFQMAQHRREHPADDLLTALVEAEEDGHRLTDAEIAQFMLLLSVAGNDTTRNTTSWAMKALTDFPAQRALLIENLDGTLPVAVDEFVRWASPVMHFKRTATKDTVIGDQEIRGGDEVVMIYSSGNRDERAFDDPGAFDVTRSPNRHVGFGGGGPHFCMGAALARTQLQAIFTELLIAFPDLHVGEPKLIVGNFMNAVGSLPMDSGARR